MKICALATGLADKAVSLVYERVLRKEPSKIWVDRCETQIGGVLEVLEKSARRGRDARAGSASASAMPTSRSPACCDSPARRIRRCFTAARYPALAAHGAACEALPVFQEIAQPLAPPERRVKRRTFLFAWELRRYATSACFGRHGFGKSDSELPQQLNGGELTVFSRSAKCQSSETSTKPASRKSWNSGRTEPRGTGKRPSTRCAMVSASDGLKAVTSIKAMIAVRKTCLYHFPVTQYLPGDDLQFAPVRNNPPRAYISFSSRR